MTKTIKIGGKVTKEDLKDFKVSYWAYDILEKVSFSKESKDIELEIISVAELGLPDGGTISQIYAKAKERGLELCPAEVGPQLRLQYKDQPKGEWLLVAMEPITDSDGGLHIFSVEHDGDGLWLDAYCGDPDNFYRGSNRFLFVLPRKYSLETSLPSDFELRLLALEEKFKKLDKIINYD